MNWIFPIAGHGTRTSSLGEYKPLIEIFPQYSILKLCLAGLGSIIQPGDTLVFITTDGQERAHDVTANVQLILEALDLKAMAQVIILNNTPPGQALTLKYGIDAFGESFMKEKTFVVNSDQVVFFDLKNVNMNRCGTGLYFSDGTSSCFFDIDINNKSIKQIKEKQKISCYASAGVFYFTSAQEILDCIEWGIDNRVYYNNELYLGPCMQYFNDLSYFQTIMKFDLGTPPQIDLFRKFSEHLIEQGA